MAEVEVTVPREVASPVNKNSDEEILPTDAMTSAATSRPVSATSSEDVELHQLNGTETNVAMREDIPPDGGYGIDPKA